MEVKVKRAGKWAITPAGPIEEIEVGQIIGDKYTEKFRQDLVDAEYADIIVPEPDPTAEPKDMATDYATLTDPAEIKEVAKNKYGVTLKGNKSAETLKNELSFILSNQDPESGD